MRAVRLADPKSITISVDNWVQGAYPATCSRGKGLFENWDMLYIERMLGVPQPCDGADNRWIDNMGGTVIARDTRFGGEGGKRQPIAFVLTHPTALPLVGP